MGRSQAIAALRLLHGAAESLGALTGEGALTTIPTWFAHAMKSSAAICRSAIDAPCIAAQRPHRIRIAAVACATVACCSTSARPAGTCSSARARSAGAGASIDGRSATIAAHAAHTSPTAFAKVARQASALARASTASSPARRRRGIGRGVWRRRGGAAATAVAGKRQGAAYDHQPSREATRCHHGQQNILSPVALMEIVVHGEASTDWLQR
jgi:hypothetical protein